MALEYIVDSLDGLDESQKGLYVEKDGKFSLDVNLGDMFVPSSDVTGLKANHDKLLAEKKEAQRQAKEAAAEAQRIADENAAKSGDVESLTKSWAEKEKSYQEQLNGFKQKEDNFEISKAADNVVEGLAEGANAKLLKEFVKKRLKREAGEVKVVDAHGNLTISTLDDLKAEFEKDETYNSLKIGSKASGSGATKSNNGGAGVSEIKREQFDAMSHLERSDFFKSGGKVVD